MSWIVIALFAVWAPATRPDRPARHVVVVIIDGLRSDYVLQAERETVQSLARLGASSFTCRTPTNAGSRLTERSILAGSASPADALPTASTLISLVKASGGSTTLVGYRDRNPATTAAVDTFISLDDEWCGNGVVLHALRAMTDHRPTLLLVHLGSVGKFGEIGVSTGLVVAGELQKEINRLELSEPTLLIVTGADEPFIPDGGGQTAMVPWIVIGPGVKENFDLDGYRDLRIHSEDTFATACHFLRIDPGPVDGKNIAAAFVEGGYVEYDRVPPMNRVRVSSRPSATRPAD